MLSGDGGGFVVEGRSGSGTIGSLSSSSPGEFSGVESICGSIDGSGGLDGGGRSGGGGSDGKGSSGASVAGEVCSSCPWATTLCMASSAASHKTARKNVFIMGDGILQLIEDFSQRAKLQKIGKVGSNI